MWPVAPRAGTCGIPDWEREDKEILYLWKGPQRGPAPPAGCQVGARQRSGANGHLPSLSIALIVLSGGTEHSVKWDRDSISNEQIDSVISCHLVPEGATHCQRG